MVYRFMAPKGDCQSVVNQLLRVQPWDILGAIQNETVVVVADEDVAVPINVYQFACNKIVVSRLGSVLAETLDNIAFASIVGVNPVVLQGHWRPDFLPVFDSYSSPHFGSFFQSVASVDGR